MADRRTHRTSLPSTPRHPWPPASWRTSWRWCPGAPGAI